MNYGRLALLIATQSDCSCYLLSTVVSEGRQQHFNAVAQKPEFRAALKSCQRRTGTVEKEQPPLKSGDFLFGFSLNPKVKAITTNTSNVFSASGSAAATHLAMQSIPFNIKFP